MGAPNNVNESGSLTDEGIVEGSEDTGNTEHELALTDLGAELDILLRSGGLGLLGRHGV